MRLAEREGVQLKSGKIIGEDIFIFIFVPNHLKCLFLLQNISLINLSMYIGDESSEIFTDKIHFQKFY